MKEIMKGRKLKRQDMQKCIKKLFSKYTIKAPLKEFNPN